MSRDYADQTAPHGKGEGGLEQAAEVFVECGLVDNGASVLAAQVGRARRQRDDFVAGGEADAVGEDVVALVFEHNLLDRLRRPVEPPRPARRGLDELQRHVLVVADVPAVDAGASAGGRAQRAVGGLGPGDADAAGFFADLDLGLIGQPSTLIRK